MTHFLNRHIPVLLSLLTAGFAQLNQPLNLPTAPGEITDADPVSVATGIYWRSYTDFYVNDSIPIEFERTYRNQDAMSRSFGIGTSTSYDMFIIGDSSRFSWVALVMPDGTRVEYTRISPGIGYADGVFEARGTPNHFLNSRIFWNPHGSWTVKLTDGIEFTVQACRATSKPGQCAVTEIRNGVGDRLAIERDRDGNMKKITSPHGHVLTLNVDSSGRITRAGIDNRHWIIYSYDQAGRLIATKSSSGKRQQFTYDSASNMLSVQENGYVVRTRFDEKNRFSWQKISNGDVFSAKYRTDEKGKIVGTDIRGPDGLLVYDFDVSGRTVREEFRPGTSKRWQLEYARDPQTNVLQSLLLTCGANRRVFLPPSIGPTLGELGEAHKQYVTEMCWRTPPARKTTKPKKIVSGPIMNGN